MQLITAYQSESESLCGQLRQAKVKIDSLEKELDELASGVPTSPKDSAPSSSSLLRHSTLLKGSPLTRVKEVEARAAAREADLKHDGR